MANGWEVVTCQVDLHSKKAIVSFRRSDGAFVSLSSFDYDKPGQQTEGELKKMAIAAARVLLVEASTATFGAS